MLVLTRKLWESIYIGEGPARIVVYVAEIQRGRVRLGVTAPGDMRISRSEPNSKEPPRDDRV